MGNKRKPINTLEKEENVLTVTEWQENITTLDLSNRGITNFDGNIKLPPNLIELNLSNNKFTEIPSAVLNLENLKTLDLSYNKLVLFDETPNCCHTLESLNLSNNQLEGPPYWVWTETPKNMLQLDLSNNNNLCQSFVNNYFEELLQYTNLVNVVHLYNCKLGKHMKLMTTFRHAKIVHLGNTVYNFQVNHIENVPCIGLEDCLDIEVMNLCNTNIYNVQHNIDIYENLVEINLSQNHINSLPNEFCNLGNLKICILSFNKILYLPDEIHKLVKLTKLYLDNNELCMLPETLHQITNLRTLDLYNNHLYEGVQDLKKLDEYDFAQNYNEEPNIEEYLEKKEKLRQNCSSRLDGRVPEVVLEESERSETDVDDDDFRLSDTQEAVNKSSRCSSPEDWDSDEYWIPSHIDYSKTTLYKLNSPPAMQWLEFIKRKMAEGNFCPIDMHLSISITEKVKYEKMNNPQPVYESDGQFDDYSDDDT